MGITQDFISIDEQISLLQSRNLSFQSVEDAKILLEYYGYYNIINGYKEPYIIKSNNCTEYYKDGITFEQIYSLFQLDHALRNQLMLTILDLEEHLRAVTAYVIGESFGSDMSEYLKFKNYQNRKVANSKFSLNSILDNLRKTALSNKDPIKYHREKYGNVPPWVLFKGIFLSTLVNFIRLQKPAQKTAIMTHMYLIDSQFVDEYLRDLFIDTLFLCLEYRNLAAHAGRVYNYSPDSKIRITTESEEALIKIIPSFSLLHNTHSLGTLVCLLSLFERKAYTNSLKQIMEKEVKKHCEKYPNDFDFLMESLGINNIAHPKHKY